MTISQIYDKYYVSGHLREHMTRVAAVAWVIFDAHKESNPALSGKKELISACLLHDIANLLKSHAGSLPKFFEPEGKEYWMQKYEEMANVYGNDVDQATIKIAKELGVSDRTLEILSRIGYASIDQAGGSGDIVSMIANYADMRVPPWGVDTLSNRILDGKQRYKGTGLFIESEHFEEVAKEEERVLFTDLSLRPEDITEEMVLGIKESLLSYEIV